MAKEPFAQQLTQPLVNAVLHEPLSALFATGICTVLELAQAKLGLGLLH